MNLVNPEPPVCTCTVYMYKIVHYVRMRSVLARAGASGVRLTLINVIVTKYSNSDVML